MKNEIRAIQFWGLTIHNLDYEDLYDIIYESVKGNIKTIISYSNVNTLNKIYYNKDLCSSLNKFDIIHPDGIGIYLAVNFLFPKNKLKKRITGSDFYSILIKKCIIDKLSVFFFGHDDRTLEKIKSNNPDIIIAGVQNGYDFKDEDLIHDINSSKPNILIVGLGFPEQEKWILKNKSSLLCNTILAVGDGIKIFAGTKIRGPRLIQKVGFEWLVRLISNPKKYSSRYFIGIPLFSVRIIKTKMIKLLS